jgi:signal transduction histidine kinase/CheY-like chemotaxis protein
MAIAFYVPEDRERVQLAVQQAINKGEPFEFEAEIITATGRRIWVSTRGLPVRDAEGNVCGARGVVKDIDASRRAAEELRRRDNQFRLFSQHLPGLLYQYRIDANGHASFPSASGALDEVWGVPADQLAQDAQLLVNLVHPDDRPRLEQSISESAANLKRFTAKHRFHHPVRGLRWLQSSSSPVRQADGSIDWYGFSMDITESVLAAQAIRDSDERFRFIASQVPGVVFQLRISPNGALSFPFLSAGFEQQFGIPIADFQSNHRLAAERIHPEDILRFRDAVKASAQFSLGSPLLPDRWSLDWRHLHPLKGERHLRASSAPTREADGSVLWNGYCIDETERILAAREREEMERQLQHAQKLESLGILAGGVAHDFNNLLAAIMGNLDIALEEGQELPPAIREAVSNALTITHRAADLTRQMLAYSGKGQFLVSPVNLSTLVNENAAMLRAAIHRSIRLEIQISQQDAQILGDPGQLQQIVMNLITNAAEAIERNGTIRLMVRLKNFTRDQLALNRADTELAPGVYVTLEVSDNGHGMGPETLARLFDPFFTTKFTGRGLGLSALLGIVKGHGGGILVESTPGAGTCFRVLFPPHGHPAIAVIDEPTTQAVIPLPVAEDPSSAPWALTIPIRDTPSSDAPREGILIIDDEVNILAFCRRALEKRGLNVLTASSGEDGLLLYRQQHATIATVLVDLTMPELDGIATLRLLRQVDPAPRFVLTSGYGEVAIPPDQEVHGIAGFLQKPFRLEELVRQATAGLPHN